MSFLRGRLFATASCAVLLVMSAAAVQADDTAFMGTVNGSFGTIDLKTGAFTLDGNSGVTLAGMAVENATLYASSYHTSTGVLYTVNPTNGAVTAVGTSTLNIDDFGSTTSGLFAVGSDTNLYSINATTGAATLIGPTGLAFGTWRSLSTNSSTLYFSNGTNLYTLNTSTGAATLVGSMGTSMQGAMVFEDGILYGGANIPGLTVDMLNQVTGAATVGPTVSGTTSSFFALAPNPLPSSTSTPEPASLTMVGTGILGLAAALKRRRRQKSRHVSDVLATTSL